jgi:hypothetical protein
MSKRFENSAGLVMMMTLKGMHQVHSHNKTGVTVFKSTDADSASRHYTNMVNETNQLERTARFVEKRTLELQDRL